LRLCFSAPHSAVVTQAPFDTLIRTDAIDLPIDWAQDMAFASATHRDYLCDYAGTHRLAEDQIRRARQCYYGYVACVDHIFGKLLDGLDARGELDNTIIAFVADHGAHLGDHGFFQKQSFWDASARVPLFFAGPGIREQCVDRPVNVGSLLPTLLDLVGLDLPRQAQFDTLSATLCHGATPKAKPVFSEIDYGLWHYRPDERHVMIRDGRWKLMMYRDPHDPDRLTDSEDRVLFDLEADPQERHNLALGPECHPIIDDLIAKIDRWDRSRPVVPSSLTAQYQR
jgi:arylsulfatase A-like enzyme